MRNLVDVLLFGRQKKKEELFIFLTSDFHKRNNDDKCRRKKKRSQINGFEPLLSYHSISPSKKLVVNNRLCSDSQIFMEPDLCDDIKPF